MAATGLISSPDPVGMSEIRTSTASKLQCLRNLDRNGNWIMTEFEYKNTAVSPIFLVLFEVGSMILNEIVRTIAHEITYTQSYEFYEIHEKWCPRILIKPH